MEVSDLGQVLPKRIFQQFGEHSDPVLVTLARSDDHLPSGEIDILHPEAQPFHEPHAGAEQEPCDQLRDPAHPVQQPANLPWGQDDWQPLRRLGLDHPLKPGEVHP